MFYFRLYFFSGGEGANSHWSRDKGRVPRTHFAAKEELLSIL